MVVPPCRQLCTESHGLANDIGLPSMRRKREHDGGGLPAAHGLGRIVVPLITPAFLAGPPMVAGPDPRRAIAVPLMTPRLGAGAPAVAGRCGTCTAAAPKALFAASGVCEPRCGIPVAAPGRGLTLGRGIPIDGRAELNGRAGTKCGV